MTDFPQDHSKAAVGLLEGRMAVLENKRTEARALRDVGAISIAELTADLLSYNKEIAELQAEKEELLNSMDSQLHDLRAGLFTAGATVSIAKAAELKKLLTERFDALNLDGKREQIKEHLTIVVGEGRGTDRVEILYNKSEGLNDEKYSDEEGSQDAV